jgi:ketosteroid isomerase-like protein
MSQEFLDAFRAGYEAAQKAFNQGDYDSAYARLAPDVEYHPLRRLLESGVKRGKEEMRAFFESAREGNDWKPQAQEYIDAGDAAAIVRLRGTTVGRTTRIANTLEFYELVEFGSDGLIRRIRDYEKREDALEAAGLSK